MNMKRIRRFNESESQDIRLTMDEISSIDPGIKKNYGFPDDQEFIIPTSGNYYRYPKAYGIQGEFGGQEAKAYFLYTAPSEERKKANPRLKYGYQIGFAILIDGEVKHLVTFYEPHGATFIEGKDLFVAYGHEDVVLLFPDGEIKTIHTR